MNTHAYKNGVKKRIKKDAEQTEKIEKYWKY